MKRLTTLCVLCAVLALAVWIIHSSPVEPREKSGFSMQFMQDGGAWCNDGTDDVWWRARKEDKDGIVWCVAADKVTGETRVLREGRP